MEILSNWQGYWKDQIKYPVWGKNLFHPVILLFFSLIIIILIMLIIIIRKLALEQDSYCEDQLR